MSQEWSYNVALLQRFIYGDSLSAQMIYWPWLVWNSLHNWEVGFDLFNSVNLTSLGHNRTLSADLSVQHVRSIITYVERGKKWQDGDIMAKRNLVCCFWRANSNCYTVWIIFHKMCIISTLLDQSKMRF